MKECDVFKPYHPGISNQFFFEELFWSFSTLVAIEWPLLGHKTSFLIQEGMIAKVRVRVSNIDFKVFYQIDKVSFTHFLLLN